MKYLILFISLIFFLETNAQNKVEGIILNHETKEIIPFVNISLIGIDKGTSSLENGCFSLEIDSNECELIFSSVGYEDKMINCSNIDTVYLNPQSILLNEFIIREQKKDKFLSIGEFKKKEARNGFACSTSPWMIGRFFPYEKDFEKTPFIHSFKIGTQNRIRTARFLVRLYNVGNNGLPNELIHNEKIEVQAGKNKKITEVDISHLKILFPNKGVIIALEWLFVPENFDKRKITMAATGKTVERVYVEPTFLADIKHEHKNTIRYGQGKWYKSKPFGYVKYWTPAIELKLSN